MSIGKKGRPETERVLSRAPGSHPGSASETLAALVRSFSPLRGTEKPVLAAGSPRPAAHSSGAWVPPNSSWGGRVEARPHCAREAMAWCDLPRPSWKLVALALELSSLDSRSRKMTTASQGIGKSQRRECSGAEVP